MFDKIRNILGNKKQGLKVLDSEVATKEISSKVRGILGNLSDADIQKLVEEKLDYLKWLIRYSKANNLKLVPSPKGLNTFACGLDSSCDEIFRKYMKGQIKIHEIPKDAFKPALFYYNLKMLLESDTKTLGALSDHEIGHAEDTDYSDILYISKFAKDSGLPISPITLFFNGANEDPFIGKRVSKKSPVKKNGVEYLYKNTLAKTKDGNIDLRKIPKIDQLATKIAYNWLNNDFSNSYNVEIHVDDDVKKIFDEQILPNFDKMISPDIPNIQRTIFKNSILLPILQDLGKKDLETAKQMNKLMEMMKNKKWPSNTDNTKSQEGQEKGQPSEDSSGQSGNKSDQVNNSGEESSKGDGEKTGEKEGDGNGEKNKTGASGGGQNTGKEDGKDKGYEESGGEKKGQDTGKEGKTQGKGNDEEDKNSKSGEKDEDTTEKDIEKMLEDLKKDPEKLEDALKKAQEEIDKMSDKEKEALENDIKKKIDKDNLDKLNEELPSMDWSENKDGELEFKPKTVDKEAQREAEKFEKKLDEIIKKQEEDIEKTKEIQKKINDVDNLENLDVLENEMQEIKSNKLKDSIKKQIQTKKNNIEEERKRKLQNMIEQGFDSGYEKDYNDFIALENQIEGYVDDFINDLIQYIPKLKDYIYTGSYNTGNIYDIPKAAREIRMGHYSVYGRKEEVETMKINIGISISLDISGSMEGIKMKESLKLMIFLGIFCDKLKIPFYINTIGNFPTEVKSVQTEYYKSKGNIMKITKNPNENTYMQGTFEQVQEVIGEQKFDNPEVEFIPVIITDGCSSDSDKDELKKTIDKFDGLDVIMGLCLSQSDKTTLSTYFKKGKKIFLDDATQILDKGRIQLTDYLVDNKDRLFKVNEN